MKTIIHNSLEPFPLPVGSVNLIITSPPYWNCRNYRNQEAQIGLEENPYCDTGECGKCYVCHMRKVGINAKASLAETGSYFLNIGDSYFTVGPRAKSLTMVPVRVAIAMCNDGWILRNVIIWQKPSAMPTSVKDRLRNTYEYIFHFVKNRHYFYNLDPIREPHKTIAKYRGFEEFVEKISDESARVKQAKIPGSENAYFVRRYKESKTQSEEVTEDGQINIGARSGFVENGESVANRYSDGGKNPGDVMFVPEKEHKFTLADELRAEQEKGYTRRAAARTTARLSHRGMVKNHPLGKNPGDLCSDSDSAHEGKLIESVLEPVELFGFDAECPACGSQFHTPIEAFATDTPDDIWVLSQEPNRLRHFATWPTKLVRRMVLIASRPGDTVLDPFVGSGTSLIVAESLGRNGIGFDLDYSDVRNERAKSGIQKEMVLE